MERRKFKKMKSVPKAITQNIIIDLGLNSGYGRGLKELLDIMHTRKEGIKDE